MTAKVNSSTPKDIFFTAQTLRFRPYSDVEREGIESEENKTCSCGVPSITRIGKSGRIPPRSESQILLNFPGWPIRISTREKSCQPGGTGDDGKQTPNSELKTVSGDEVFEHYRINKAALHAVSEEVVSMLR